jgi:hypothetical protein
MVALVPRVPGAGHASQGTTSVEVVGTASQLDDDIKSLLQDSVMHGVDTCVLRSAALGDAAPAPGSSDATGPGVSRLYLPGSASFLPPPINWRQLGDETEFVCSWVTTTERLLHDMLASVNQNIPRPIWVSPKREENLVCIPLASYTLSHPLMCFVSIALVPGSADVPALLAEVTQSWEAATALEATHVMVVHATETSAQEATTV